MKSQPIHERSIVQIDVPYEGHFTIGVRKYYQTNSFQEILDFYTDHELTLPNFWWVYEEDFPFPEKFGE